MPGPYPAETTILGVAKEVTKGVVAAPTDYVPITGLQAWRNIHIHDDTAWRGSGVDSYDALLGPWHGEIDITGNVHADLIGYMLKALLGDETIVVASPNVHTIAELNSTDFQPPSYTLTDFYGPTARAYPYCLCADLTINYQADALLTYSAKLMSRAESVATKPVPTYTTEPALESWITTVSLFGSTLVVLSGSLAMRQAVTPVPVLGQQDANSIWGGVSGVTGKLSLLLIDDTPITSFIAGTKGVLVINSSQGAGAALRQVQFTSSKVILTEAKTKRSPEGMQVDIAFKALGNLTDAGASAGYGLIKAQLSNAKAVVY